MIPIPPTMGPKIDKEILHLFDECTSVTGTYLHHDSYGPDYVCDVYHNE